MRAVGGAGVGGSPATGASGAAFGGGGGCASGASLSGHLALIHLRGSKCWEGSSLESLCANHIHVCGKFKAW